MPSRKSTKTGFGTSTKLGVFPLGNINIDVFLDWDKREGSYYFSPDLTSKPRIRVGMGYDHFVECAEVIHHEALEYILDSLKCRFQPTGPWGHDHANYIFHFNHGQFVTAVEQLTWFSKFAMPALKKAWKRKKKKKSR